MELNRLHIPIAEPYFTMILKGIKKNEYRSISKHWITRLTNLKNDNSIVNLLDFEFDFKKFDDIKFINGYGTHRPYLIIEHLGTSIGKPNIEKGGHLFVDDDGQMDEVFDIELGNIKETGNLK